MVGLCAACSEKEVQLDNTFRKEADSIYATQIDLIDDEMDSICTQIKDSLIELKYDSIITTRKRKIRELSQ